MGRRFVPQSTIDRRVQAKDDRMNAAIAAFRRRTQSIANQATDQAAFHALLVDPQTSARLDAMLADNRRIDAALADVVPVVVELEIIPLSGNRDNAVVDVALVPKIDGAQ